MKPRYSTALILLAWLLINIIQAYFTGLFNDEAYYFYYSRDLAWGYYDHPPLIALLIKAGYAIFQNELGVRFFFVLLSLGTILIIHKTAEVKDEKIFGLLVFSFLFLQVTGFMAFPDSPLLFFTAIFFLIYKKYSASYNATDAIWLGIAMAGMFYSKYLGVLIVFLTLLSNIKLLWKGSFWLAVAVTSLLFLPHLIWQYKNDFPPVYYHMLERSHDEVFRWSNFLDYLAGQLGQINPFLFIPVIYFLIIFKTSDKFDRALKFSALGCLILPFILMIKGRVEANWTMAGMIPLFIISYKMFEKKISFRRFLYITSGISLIFILLARIILINNFLPEEYKKLIRIDNYGWKEFSERISRKAGDKPVVFIGSYQNPSQYIFYTGKTAFSFNNALYRSNQYDLEGFEEELQGKEVLVITNRKNIPAEDQLEYNLMLSDSVRYPNGKYRVSIIDSNYRSYNFIRADVLIRSNEVKAGEKAEIPLILTNTGLQPVDFSEAAPSKVHLCYYFLQYGKPVVYEKAIDLSGIILKNDYQAVIEVNAPENPGTYYFKVSLKRGWMPAGINSRLVKVKVI